jgi:predicted ATPase
VVLLGGEPGSGKSRLVREFAAEAAGEGALVLYGACDAVVRTPYGAFAQALRHLVRVLDPAELRAALGSGGGELTRFLPDLPTRIGVLPPPVRADPNTERHRLHTAVTELLEAVSRRRPVLLAIEDGHWADATTLLLLRHLARSAWGGRVLLFATFRDTEADVPDALAETLADLRRADDVVRLRLGGLSDQEVGEFVARSVPAAPSPDLAQVARAITDLTAGNAFLVCELWRALLETGAVRTPEEVARVRAPLAELDTPESVREVVSQRLARLAPSTTELLELAAAAGPAFELEIIRQGSGLTERELLTALDDAVRSGFVEELQRPALAYRFTHELVRRAVYDRLTRIRRAELHLRVGEAWEAAGVPRPARYRTWPITSQRRCRSATCAGRSTTASSPHARPPTRSRSTRRPRCSSPRSISASRTRRVAPRSSSSWARSDIERARRSTPSMPSDRRPRLPVS